MYGPKASNTWPTPISLKGNTGATGNPGSKILSGKNTPSTSIGAEGDFYFDTENLNFYGPKTANNWGAAVSLKASNGITTFLYINQSFDYVTLEASYPGGGVNGNITHYSFTAGKTINITHQTYTNAYNTGIILVRLKQTNNANSVWANNIYIENTSSSNNWYDEIYIGDDDEGPEAQPTKVFIEGEQYASTDPNGNELKNFKFDVKVVCIPAGTVLQMSTKNIDTKDANAVAKYLKL